MKKNFFKFKKIKKKTIKKYVLIPSFTFMKINTIITIILAKYSLFYIYNFGKIIFKNKSNFF